MKHELNISKKKLFFFIFNIMFAAGISFFFGKEISKNKDAINLIVTVFSILAGFLIAVITLIVDPIISSTDNISELKLMRNTVRNKLRRHEWLFYLYLLSLAILLSLLIIPDTYKMVKLLTSHIFVFLSVAVFLNSFALPSSLISIQLDKYEAKIKKRTSGQNKKQE